MNQFKKYLIFIILFSLTLNEFYSESYGRIFDYFALALIILNFISFNDYKFKSNYYSIFLFFSFFIFLGILSQQFLASLAVFSGSLLIVLFVRTTVVVDKLFFAKSIYYILLIHLIFFIIQVFLFYALSIRFSVIDFFPGLQSSRVFNEGLGIIRPGGLMMEPNSYCANIFMLVFVLFRLEGKLNKLSFFSLISVIFTTSIWGTIIFFAILFLFSNFKFKLFILLFLLVSIIYVLNYIEDSVALERIFRIIDDPYSDNSVVTRLGLESTKQNSTLNWIVGNGINSKDFQLFMGGNGFSYMLFCFGFFGTIAIFIWYFISNGFRFFLLFILFNFTFPYFSYLIFYLFFAFSIKDINFIKGRSYNIF